MVGGLTSPASASEAWWRADGLAAHLRLQDGELSLTCHTGLTAAIPWGPLVVAMDFGAVRSRGVVGVRGQQPGPPGPRPRVGARG